MDHRFICVLPWNHLFVGNEGAFYPCCLGQDSFSKFKTSDGSYLSTEKNTASEVQTLAVDLIEMKKAMANGQVPKQCQYCQSIESSGRSSYRNYVNTLFPETYKRLISSTKEDTHLDLEFVDVRFGNQCNLKCRMCNPRSSSGLHQEFNKFNGTNENYSYSINAKFLDSIVEKVSSIKRVNIAGGEPFISPEVFHFIKRLSLHKESKEIVLTFNSNLTVMNRELNELWPKFKNIEIAASIDGVEKINDYIRYPSVWKKVVNNLIELKSKASIYVNCTVQIYNIFSLQPLFDFCIQQQNIHLNLNIASNPRHISVQTLPTSLKEKASELLRKLHFIYPNRSDIPALISYMNSKDSSEYFSEFLKWTSFLDKQRGQSLCQIDPIWETLLKELQQHETISL